MELKMNKIRVALVTMSLFTMLIGSSTINLSVNFVNYESGPDAIMYMGYVWEGASWEDAFAAGEVQNKMFGVFPGGTANGTYDVTLLTLLKGITMPACLRRLIWDMYLMTQHSCWLAGMTQMQMETTVRLNRLR